MPYGLPRAGYAAFLFCAMTKDILVERDGRQINIPLSAWAIMPDGKYGWSPVHVKMPAVVVAAMESVAAKEEAPKPEKVKKTRQKRAK